MNRNQRNLFLSLVVVLFSLGWLPSYSQSACGCTFVISLNSSEIIFDGAVKKVKPGDKICIASGTRTGISFSNIVGTKDKPVTITNMCDGKVTLKVPSNWGNGVEFLGSSFFRFTGSGNASEPIGIEIVGAGNKTGATHGMNLMGLSTNFEVDHVNVHDFGGVGIVAKTDPTCTPSTWRANFTLKDISLHHNIVANTGVEGFYVGNSHYDDGVTKTCSGVSTLIQEHLVDGVLIYNNTVSNTGNEGIQVGAASNAVAHHNTITNAGAINSDPSQANSFQSGSGTQMTAYNNIMDGSKGYGVINLSGGGTYYNNIMMNNAKGAILLEDRNLRPTGFRVFNNTFLNNTEAGVWMYSTNPVMSYLYNNIIIDQNISNYRYVVLVSPGANKLTQSNNYTSHDINTVKFTNVAGKNFHLLTGSPAIDAGKDVSSFLVNFDFDDKTRPKGTAFDIGAYEYQPSGPKADAGVDQSITLPTNSINLAGIGTSATGITNYQWTKKSGGAATLANATTPNLGLSGLVEGTYVFELQVTDASGFDFDQITVNVLPVAANQNPKANAGTDPTVTLPTSTITLNGIGTDADGSISSYAWVKISGPTATLYGANTPSLGLSALIEGVYVFQLTVTDDKMATDADQVTVTVNAATVNQIPVVNTTLTKTLFLPSNQLTLTATASDPDGSISTILWEKKSGGAATLTNANTLSLGVADLALGKYTIRITVTDNKGAIAFADVVVNVLQANQSPTANAGADQPLTLPTDFTTVVGLGNDPDGVIASYSWTKVSGPTATLTGANTSTLSLSNLIQGTYVFGLTVTDNNAATGYDEMVVAVSVAPTGPNESPLAISGGNVSFSLPVNSTNLYGSGFDPDGTIVSYSWSKASGGGATLTNVNNPTLTVSNLTAGQYSFRLLVTDNKGATDDDIAIVTVSDIGTNIFPIASAGAGKIVKVPQSSVALTGSGTDADGEITTYLWTQVSGATVTIDSPSTPSTIISGLAEGDYSFRLTVTDDQGATDLDEVTVRVVSSSNNLPPLVNAGADVTLFLPQSTYTFDASASDDGAISAYQWFKLGGPGVTLINPTEEDLSVKDLVQGDYTFQLSVTDNNAATVFDIVKISVLPSTFKPPVVNAGDDQVIVLPIDQTDLAGAASPSASIISTQWQQIVGPSSATLAGENTLSLQIKNMVEGTYVFKLTATDNTSKEVSDNVQVIVKPIPPNQPPLVTAGVNTSIILPTSQVILAGTATDTDGTVVLLKWTQVQGPSTATLQNTTTLTLTASDLVQGTYVFRLTATDNSGDSGSNEVLVSVSSPISTEKQIPVVFAGDDVVLVDPDNEVTIEGKGIDPDGAIQSFVWEQLTGEPVDFTVSNQTIITVKGLSLGMYSFRLTATDDDQQEGFDDVQISVIEKNQEIPKFFSPNNDGIGEYWVFRNIDSYQQCKVSVFSRAGQVVYEAAPYHNDWNGTYNGKPLGDGDFYYNIKCGDGRVVTGALRIIR